MLKKEKVTIKSQQRRRNFYSNNGYMIFTVSHLFLKIPVYVCSVNFKKASFEQDLKFCAVKLDFVYCKRYWFKRCSSVTINNLQHNNNDNNNSNDKNNDNNNNKNNNNNSNNNNNNNNK